VIGQDVTVHMVAECLQYDGSLFGEGIKSRIKEKLLTECDVHTVVRLADDRQMQAEIAGLQAQLKAGLAGALEGKA
jgi:hypothetical protein